MNNVQNSIVRLKIVVKELKIAGSMLFKNEYKYAGDRELINSLAAQIDRVVNHSLYDISQFTENDFVINTVANVLANLTKLKELMVCFHNSSGRKLYTNFSYIRNYAISTLEKIIFALTPLQNEVNVLGVYYQYFVYKSPVEGIVYVQYFIFTLDFYFAR